MARTWVYTGSKWEVSNSGSLQVYTVFNQANVANTLPVGNTLTNTFFSLNSSRRTKLNFVPSGSITINVDDDSAGGRVNVTVAGVASAGALLRAPQVYTALGASTWSKPTNLGFIIVEVQGGGGGSAGAAVTNNLPSGGGGAGGYARKAIAAASLGATETLSVGSGGAGGATGGGAGAAGGSSSFGTTSFCTACGGTPGPITVVAADGILGGSGGLATSGDVNCQGGDGGAGAGLRGLSGGTSVRPMMFGGNGGESFFGGGGAGMKSSFSGAIQVTAPGKAYGSGAGGASIGDVATVGSGAPGAAGQQGIVIIWEFA